MSIHNMFFLFSMKTCCGYSLEMLQWGVSNEYHNIFFMENIGTNWKCLNEVLLMRTTTFVFMENIKKQHVFVVNWRKLSQNYRQILLLNKTSRNYRLICLCKNYVNRLNIEFLKLVLIVSVWHYPALEIFESWCTKLNVLNYFPFFFWK